MRPTAAIPAVTPPTYTKRTPFEELDSSKNGARRAAHAWSRWTGLKLGYILTGVEYALTAGELKMEAK